MKRSWILLLPCFASPAAAQYSIPRFTIDGGGGTSAAGVMTLTGTIGQADCGAMTGGAYALWGGFWGGGVLVATDVPPALEEAPASLAFHLHAAAPNPLVGRTTVRFDVPESRVTRLQLFDVSGRLVRTLVDGVVPAGRHEEVWDGRDSGGRPVTTGIYFVRLESGADMAQSRIAVLR